MKKQLAFLILTLVLSTVSAYAQNSPGCGETDYKCQLDVAMAALKADSKNPENHYNIGVVYQRSGAHKEAVESFTTYVGMPGIKPEYLADGYNNRGISQRKLGRLDLAIADYTKAISLTPADAKLYANRGNANSDLKKYDLALADYAAAMKIDPRYAAAYSGRGGVYNSTARYREAIIDLTTAISLDPNEPENYYNRAFAFGKVGEHVRVINDLNEYIPMLSGNITYLGDAYLNRGNAYLALARLDEAVTDYTKVIELQPDRALGYKNRAIAYRKMNKLDLAAADEKRAAELK